MGRRQLSVLPTQAMPEAVCVNVCGTLHADIRDEKKLFVNTGQASIRVVTGIFIYSSASTLCRLTTSVYIQRASVGPVQ